MNINPNLTKLNLIYDQLGNSKMTKSLWIFEKIANKYNLSFESRD